MLFFHKLYSGSDLPVDLRTDLFAKFNQNRRITFCYGDASPDGLAHGFEGAESPEDLVAPPDDDPDSEPVPHLPPQLKALEWLDTMGSPDDVPPIDR